MLLSILKNDFQNFNDFDLTTCEIYLQRQKLQVSLFSMLSESIKFW